MKPRLWQKNFPSLQAAQSKINSVIGEHRCRVKKSKKNVDRKARIVPDRGELARSAGFIRTRGAITVIVVDALP